MNTEALNGFGGHSAGADKLEQRSSAGAQRISSNNSNRKLFFGYPLEVELFFGCLSQVEVPKSGSFRPKVAPNPEISVSDLSEYTHVD